MSDYDSQWGEISLWCRGAIDELSPRAVFDEVEDGVEFDDRPKQIAVELLRKLIDLDLGSEAAKINLASCTNARAVISILETYRRGYAQFSQSQESEAEISPEGAPAIAGETPPRPAYNRDHLFLKWYERKGESTFKSPASIRDKWNGMTGEQRASFYPDDSRKLSSGSSGTSVVKTAIAKAQRERDSKT